MATIATYSPERFTVTIAGADITGFADGTAITATRNNANTTVKEGIQGDQAITKIASNSGTLSFSLLQNSPSNAIMAALQNYDDLLNDDISRFDVTIQEPGGGFLLQCTTCHLMNPADMDLGDEQMNRTWEIYVEEMTYVEVPDGFVQTAGNAAIVAGAINTIQNNSNLINSIV